MRDRSREQATELRRLTSLVEHVPVPLVTLHADGAVSLLNNAARRLLGAHQVTRIEDLERFGRSFQNSVAEAVPGARELVTFEVDGVEYQLTLATTEITVGSRTERLVSLQDIQSELDSTQAEAWHGQGADARNHEFHHPRHLPGGHGVRAQRRDQGQGRSRFSPGGGAVRSQRRGGHGGAPFGQPGALRQQLPADHADETAGKKPGTAGSAVYGALPAREVPTLARAEWDDPQVELELAVEPEGLDVLADRDMLEPVLINLLRNAWQATEGVSSPRVQLHGRLNRRGNVIVEVTDNGPGVPPELEARIFVPFFTTRPEGSGVGLALARQVMIAHGGFIRVGAAEHGGAKFTLIF